MFQPRTIETRPDWLDPDGIKLYTISARNLRVDQRRYLQQLERIKKRKAVAWASTPAFAIFHDGAERAYLILAWWGNGNELFTSVSVQTDSGWVEDATRYSFCVHDIEVIWHERNCFVECMCCGEPSLVGYRAQRGDKQHPADTWSTHIP